MIVENIFCTAGRQGALCSQSVGDFNRRLSVISALRAEVMLVVFVVSLLILVDDLLNALNPARSSS